MKNQKKLCGLFREIAGSTVYQERDIKTDVSALIGYWPAKIKDYRTFGGPR